MNLYLGANFPGQADEAQILNDDGIHVSPCY